MSDELADLKIIRDQIIANIKLITAKPTPDYSIDGQSVSKTGYLTSAFQQLAMVREQIAMLEPFELETEAETEGF